MLSQSIIYDISLCIALFRVYSWYEWSK